MAAVLVRQPAGANACRLARMHPVLESLLAQHRDMARLIGLLECQPSLEPDPAAPHVGLLVDVMTYLTHFPDVSHHPVEDRIAERLSMRRSLATDLCAELQSQHARLAQQGPELLRDMEGAMRRETVPLELVALNSRLYAERLRHNIAFEELVLIPRADRFLDGADWAAITSTYAPASDPLFSGEVDQRFERLRRAIAAQADCGCDPAG